MLWYIPPYKSYYIGDFNGTTEPNRENPCKIRVFTGSMCCESDGTTNGTDGTGDVFPAVCMKKDGGLLPRPGDG